MKHHNNILLLFLLLLTSLSLNAAAMRGHEDDAQGKAPTSINLVFIGNSITAGATLSDPSRQAPPVICRDMVEKATGVHTNVYNGGHSGITTFGFMPGRRDFVKVVDAALRFQKANGGVVYFSIMLGLTTAHAQPRREHPSVPKRMAGTCAPS